MDAHTLALIPLHQFCLCACRIDLYACTDPGPEIDTPHAWPDRFCTVYTVHLVNRPEFQKWYLYGSFWYLTWYSLQVAKTLLFCIILLLNQTCYPFVNIGLIQTHRPSNPFVNHRQSDCHAHWTAPASHRPCNLVMPDRVQSPLLFFACVLPDPQNH